MSPRLLSAAEREIGGVALLVLLAGILVAATTSPGALDREAVLADAEVPGHRIVDIEERAGERLLTAHVVVEGTPDADGLVAVSAAVVERLRDGPGYHGLRLNLYDHELYRELDATLGRALDAPEGKWTRALRSTRDYRAHQTVVTVRDKDWDQQPTHAQVEAVVAWQREQGAMLAAVSTDPADEDPAGQPTGGNGVPPPPETRQVHAWSVSGEPVRVVLE